MVTMCACVCFSSAIPRSTAAATWITARPRSSGSFGPASRECCSCRMRCSIAMRTRRRARERFGQMGFELESIHDADGRARARRGARGSDLHRRREYVPPARRALARRLDRTDRAARPVAACRISDRAPDRTSPASASRRPTTCRSSSRQPSTALNLVPFNINPHYLDPVPGSTHMGETREERIAQFHEENLPPVVGLREGAWLLVDGSGVTLAGSTGARLFRRGQPPEEYAPGARLPLSISDAVGCFGTNAVGALD